MIHYENWIDSKRKYAENHNAATTTTTNKAGKNVTDYKTRAEISKFEQNAIVESRIWKEN